MIFGSCTSNNSEESSSLSSRKAWSDAHYQGSKSQELLPVLCKFGPSLLAVTHYSQLGAFAVFVVIASQSKTQTLNPSQCCHRIVDKHNLMYIANIGKFQALIFWCMLQSWEGSMIFIIFEGSEAYAAFYCKLTALGKIIIILKLSSWANLEENKLFSGMYGLSWCHSWALVINSEALSLESDLNWFSLQFLLISTQKQRCWSSSRNNNNNNKGENHSLIPFSKCSWFDLLMGFGFRSTLSPLQNGIGFQSQLLEKVH